MTRPRDQTASDPDKAAIFARKRHPVPYEPGATLGVSNFYPGGARVSHVDGRKTTREAEFYLSPT